MKRIVVFASGSGTNAENIIKYFQKSNLAKVTLVLSNRKNAKVLERAEKLNISSKSFTKTEFTNSENILNILKAESPDLIVLAGFLLKFPEFILKEFPIKVINIHPALLPKYGGKGMYGNGDWDEDIFWYNGGIVKETITVPKLTSEFGETGYYTLRNSDKFSFIRSGNHKDRPSQADNLHLDIWVDGVNLLRDSGSYKYNSTPDDTKYFMGTSSHNTV